MALPYQPHSEPSKEAAAAAEPTAKIWRDRVLAFIRSRGEAGAIDDEVLAEFEAAGVTASTTRPRRIDLVNAKLVKDSGGVRKTRSDRNATVWVSAEVVVEVAAEEEEEEEEEEEVTAGPPQVQQSLFET